MIEKNLLIHRRALIAGASVAALLPSGALARTPKEIKWDDLIPDGIPYSEIVGEGALDTVNDTWNPIYDENAQKLNETLHDQLIKMPGYMIPLEVGSEGVTDFILAPYVGACIHTPPPPANQLVMVVAQTPWPNDRLWDAVWVTGIMRTQLGDTELGQTGYTITGAELEVFEW